MTPTPDPALAARLLELSVKSTQDPLNEDGRYFNGDWHEDLTQCSHGDTGNYSNKRDGQFIAALWNAYRDGQLITLADHEAAMQEITYERDFLCAQVEAMREMAPPLGDRPLFKRLMEVRSQSDAMQAAVAKAVEASVNAENEACAKMLDNEADDYEADASRFRGGTDPHHFRMNLASTARKYAAAIRSRGVAG